MLVGATAVVESILLEVAVVVDVVAGSLEVLESDEEEMVCFEDLVTLFDCVLMLLLFADLVVVDDFFFGLANEGEI